MGGHEPAHAAPRIATTALLLAVAVPGTAQDAAGEVFRLETVVVTGTNIPRVEAESGLPVQVITLEQMFQGAMQTPQDLLQRISANQSFGAGNEALGVGGVQAPGFTGASLRGLGAARTLVLLNGRRLSPYAAQSGQGVDISAIPQSALQRVEVLKDGASAIYGTDAIGGVINYILRADFQGAEVNANYFATQEGGGNNWRANATLGYGDLAKDKYNVFLTLDHFRQDALKAADRASTRTAYLPGLGIDKAPRTSLPANISQPGGFMGFRNPTVPFPGGATASSCLPPYSFPTIDDPYVCRFDYAAVSDAIPEATKTNAFGRLVWQISADTQLFAEGSYYHGVFTEHTAPTPVVDLPLPPTSPFYPTAFVAGLPGGDPALPVNVRYRTLDLGPRVDQSTTDQWRVVAGLQGDLAGWDYTLVADATANREHFDFKSGYVYAPAFDPLFESGAIDPFGFNTGTALEELRATAITGQGFLARASDYGASLTASRGIYQLPARQLSVALGVEARREHLDQTNADAVVNGDIVSLGPPVPSFPGADRSIWAVYGEAVVLFTKTFEADVAIRYDHYSDFGGTTNPKIALRWQPMRSTLFRASWGKGFRVPTLSDLFLPLMLSGNTSNGDPVRCPVTGSDYDCGGEFPVLSGGNPHLQPETSTQWGVGLVVEPIVGFSAGVDYFRVKIRNVIDQLTEDALFGNFAFWAPTKVVRKPPTSADIALGLPGAIDHVIEDTINYGTLQTSGIDVDLRYRTPVTPMGQLSASLTGTYVIDYNRVGIEPLTFPSGVGTRSIFMNGAVTRWRHYATLNWIYGPWGATLANTYQDGYSEPCNSLDASGCLVRRVGAYSIWDVQGRYTGYKNLTLALGIRNLMNTAPPLSNQGNTHQVGIEPAYADPRGRMFYGAIRYAFN